MYEDKLLLLKGEDIHKILDKKETDIIEIVKDAYVTHGNGQSALPHSNFLRFPNSEKNRIISLPAYLGDEFDIAGMKWISSFPSNIELGIERASAVMMLNSTKTGRILGILESSIISAKRTAASAALGARYLSSRVPSVVGLIGCGLINFEIIKFLYAEYKSIDKILVFDLDNSRAENFKKICEKSIDGIKINICDSLNNVFKNSDMISFATTSAKPYVEEIYEHKDDVTILHISLRDLSPNIILSSKNIVDDIDHVTRAQTSIHLTEQIRGNRDFIDCTISDIISGKYQINHLKNSIKVYSPFGLGVLDIALGKFVYEKAIELNMGSAIDGFFPTSWNDRK